MGSLRRIGRSRIVWLGLLLALMALSQAQEAQAQAIELPQGFRAVRILDGLRLPTDMVFLPSGDILITEKGTGRDAEGIARVRLVRQGVLRNEPVLEIGASVQVDSGLASIILDPNFAENNYFYLWYATGEESLGWTGKPANRLSRFTYNPVTGTANPAGEVIILDNVPWNPIHNGGGLRFDAAGNLFIATGDVATSSNPALNVAQNYRSLGGKVLRIRPAAGGGYAIPADNPYADGRTTVNGVVPLPEIYAVGLRNPFRMVTRQADGQEFLVDVGLNVWEEINVIKPAANYGWPVREGPCPIHRKDTGCTPAPPQYTDPILAYPIPEDGGSIVGVTFYEGDAFPDAYRGRLFFADFNNGLLFTADLAAKPVTYTLFAENSGFIVDMEAGPGGIYMLEIISGSLLYIFYDGDENQPPVPSISAAPLQGAPPLRVGFSAAGTYDPDDVSLVYHWNFGDGSAPITTTLPGASHTYTRSGNFRATLQVTDRRGGESEPVSKEITVYGGPMPTIVQTTQGDPTRFAYRGGDTIRFSVQRRTGLSGLDPDTPYRWNIDLYHNEHHHPVLADYVAAEAELTIPVPSHDLNASLWYRVTLIMLTDTGIRVTVTHDVQPQLVEIQLAGWPRIAPVSINELVQPAYVPIPVVVGQSYELGAPERILFDRRLGGFSTWVVADSWPVQPNSGGIEQIEERTPTVVIGTTPKTYVAVYADLGPAPLLYFPSLMTATAE